MQQMITVLDFDDLYDKEEFYQSAPHQRINLREVPGTNGYCEDTAAETIRERIRAGKPSHIYFLGSGNYHYVSFLLQKEICRDFTLVLFDCHTDLQKPLFPELLSCGCWVRRAMDEMEHLKKVILIGTSAAYLREVEPRYRNHMAAVPEEEAVSPDFDWKTWLQRDSDGCLSVFGQGCAEPERVVYKLGPGQHDHRAGMQNMYYDCAGQKHLRGRYLRRISGRPVVRQKRDHAE